MKTGFAYDRSLNAGPKTKSLRVIVYDENSGRLGPSRSPRRRYNRKLTGH